jgi:hypothetical protein
MRRVGRYLIVVGTVTLLAIEPALSAHAAVGPIGCGVQSCVASVDGPGAGPTPVSSPGRGSGGGSGHPADCPVAYTYVPVSVAGGVASQPVPVSTGLGTYYDVVCQGTFLREVFVPAGSPQPVVATGAQLAQRALAGFALPKPVPAHAPAGEAIVHIPTYLWLAGGWGPLSATASVTGLSATVTAQPFAAKWAMGDDQEATCGGPGAPYPNDTSCSVTYVDTSADQPNLEYPATVWVYYHASWRASDGSSGDLGVLTTSTDFGVRVAQIETVNNG